MVLLDPVGGILVEHASDLDSMILSVKHEKHGGLFRRLRRSARRLQLRWFREYCQEPTVADVHDTLGLEVRDALFDDVADLVDLPFEVLLPTQQFAAFGFPEGCNNVADISLIASQLRRVRCGRRSGRRALIGLAGRSAAPAAHL